ncbi:MAG TPA: hypothetical protein VN688_23720 [Gemmataceae bacterium]|nr:hypothetical protein [Gemmataceae bacterium]
MRRSQLTQHKEKRGTIVTSEEILELKRLVDTLRARDQTYRVFGSGEKWGGHHYLFRPVLADRQLVEFERRHGVEIPTDYRLFLSLIGDGGAGPSYGVVPLAEASRCNDLSTPFVWVDKHRLDREEEFGLWERRPGCLEICHHGCGYYDLLVVNGATSGLLWQDITAATNEFIPLHKTFYVWYREWVEDKLRKLNREPLLDQISEGVHINALVDLLGGDMDTWKGAGLQPDEYYVSFRDAAASFLLDAHSKVKRIHRFSL